MPCALRARDSETFYGNSQAMVFTLKNGILDCWDGASTGGCNELYIYSHRTKGLGMGGGNGEGFAFWLDSNLCHGTSGRSDTFGNPEALSTAGSFTTQDVEVYGIV